MKEDFIMRRISQDLLSRQIKTKREKLSLSQADLSNRAHINRAMISKIENGSYMPSIEQLEDLMEYLDLSFEDISEKKEEKKRISTSSIKRSPLPVQATSAFRSPYCSVSTTASRPSISSRKKSI